MALNWEEFSHHIINIRRSKALLFLKEAIAASSHLKKFYRDMTAELLLVCAHNVSFLWIYLYIPLIRGFGSSALKMLFCMYSRCLDESENDTITLGFIVNGCPAVLHTPKMDIGSLMCLQAADCS